MFNTNVLGLLLVTKAALPLFPETGGSIVNIGSVVSTMAPPTASVYAGTKGPVDTITKTMAKGFGARKIRVNAVNPGMVITEGLHTAGMAGNAFEDQMVAMTPLGRAGHSEDIALPVVFLASEDARWITGVSLLVSGEPASSKHPTPACLAGRVRRSASTLQSNRAAVPRHGSLCRPAQVGREKEVCQHSMEK